MDRRAQHNSTSWLVNLKRGVVSRDLFVNEDIYQEEQEKMFAPRGSSWATRARSAPLAITSSPAWVKSLSSSLETTGGGSTCS
jgi:hypothetical protein